jgi:transcriptional regulator with XRE-family HTH domain
MPETDLVRTLKALQAEQGWSDERMAKELHVSQSMWTLVRQDKRRPGGKLLAGVDARFPTLRAQLLAAPTDASGRRIVEGEWAGCYRRGVHWRVPAMVVRRRQLTLEARRVTTQRQAAAAAESVVERELRLALAENTAAINRLRMAIAAAFERFAEVVNQ